MKQHLNMTVFIKSAHTKTLIQINLTKRILAMYKKTELLILIHAKQAYAIMHGSTGLRSGTTLVFQTCKQIKELGLAVNTVLILAQQTRQKWPLNILNHLQ